MNLIFRHQIIVTIKQNLNYDLTSLILIFLYKIIILNIFPLLNKLKYVYIYNIQ